jgi:hypothetical protein
VYGAAGNGSGAPITGLVGREVSAASTQEWGSVPAPRGLPRVRLAGSWKGRPRAGSGAFVVVEMWRGSCNFRD